ncbi:tRNA (adenosine(37)-N6)-threonylcarbamoyltransferase complex ATPase subunit type 1 TsaE [Candidatus Saccharibacteria bacterium]|nr:tRNA (adenosine(37)-N6)-threonylcarbamoyltransferase complex ATPase subunit type 1 TsaE [Candidatus Saccharibacteria bacterium]
MKINSEQEMIDFGRRLGEQLSGTTANKIGAKVIELLGDVGAGKTTFTRGLAEGLGIKEPVTSPSFTIMKSYASPTGKTLVHYDFYRLPDPGLMADDLADSLNNSNNIVVVEWADTVESILPDDRIIIKIAYNDDGTREVIA